MFLLTVGKGSGRYEDMNETLIVRVANALSLGAELPEIRALLIDDGLTEYEIFLTVKAAEILIKE
jgi:hypothetical protein